MGIMRGADLETVTLNIGLQNNEPFARLDQKGIADFMRRWLSAHREATGIRENTLVRVCFTNPTLSNVTEETAVVEYSGEDVVAGLLATRIERLAIDLGQEAIAVWIDHDAGNEPSKGFLAGPRAGAWGKFDPSKFDIGNANAGHWAASDLVEELQ